MRHVLYSLFPILFSLKYYKTKILFLSQIILLLILSSIIFRLFLYFYNSDVSTICKIIDSMSYSKVCKYGFPNLKEYQTAYHVVREADLLCGYDFNRAILFGVHQHNLSYTNAFHRSKQLYQERIDNIVNKHMFVTAFGQSLANELYEKELEKIECLEQML